MKSIGLIIAVVALGLIVAGCQTATRTEPLVGTVTSTSYMSEGLFHRSGPDAIKVEVDGKEKSLSSLFSDATILILTDKPCLAVDTPAVEQSHWLLNERIPVIEVSTPSEGCEAVRECAMGRGPDGISMTSVCDSRGLVRKWYGAGSGTVVLVLDQNGNVRDSGSLADFSRLRQEAERLADQAASARQQMYYYIY